MYTHLVMLPDGTELTPGPPPGHSITGVSLTRTLNGAEELTVGSACADSIEIRLWMEPGQTLRITAGDELTLFRLENGRRTQVGLFTAEKPTRSGRNTYKITAYDRMIRADTVVSDWLRTLQDQFPMPLQTLAEKTAARCGLTLENALPRNGDYQVQAFYADDLTGRQLLSWAAEAAGCYLHATPEGALRFDWYTAGGAVGPEGMLQGSLSYEDYAVAGIEKVQIRQTDTDVGVIYPDRTDAVNTYVVQGNLLLTTGSGEALKPVAEQLYEALQGITYTPCRMSVPAGSTLAPGQIVTVTDARGVQFTTWLMSATWSGGKVTLESTGSARRDSSAAVNRQSYKNLRGRILELETGVDGLRIKAGELSGDFSELRQTVEGFDAQVSQSLTEAQRYADDAANRALTEAGQATDTKLLNYTKTTTFNTRIQQLSDSISSKVSAEYVTDSLQGYVTTTTYHSMVEQLPDQITQTVASRQVGGRNLLAGSETMKSWSPWAPSGQSVGSVSFGTTADEAGIMYITNNGHNTVVDPGKYTGLTPGSYTVSVEVKFLSGTHQMGFELVPRNSAGSGLAYLNVFYTDSRMGKVSLGNGWERVWATYDVSGYTAMTGIGVYLMSGPTETAFTNKFAVRRMQLEPGGIPTAWNAAIADTEAKISAGIDGISLGYTNSGTTQRLELRKNGVTISGSSITLSGVVTFTDLSSWNQSKTVINGGNITTGQIHNLNNSTVYDLDNAWIRMGTAAGERVYLDNKHINWYATLTDGQTIGLTGVLYSRVGESYIGANSKYTSYGWVPGDSPASHTGLRITYNRSDDSDADFNTTRVGVSGTLSVQNLNAWGSKNRVVRTDYGALQLAAMESPRPVFCDFGAGRIGEDGLCVIVHDPRYAACPEPHQQVRWVLTDTSGGGALWASPDDAGATVHGRPGQTFDWLCIAAQRGCGGEYAEICDVACPEDSPAGEDWIAGLTLDQAEAETAAAETLLQPEKEETR
ncbi:MAG: hypothetical protein U0L91_05190 [Gemmiger sp.]|uniref:hypothetical protein n=1 Tax=Gemmiger sp. TaxID=2049027 RepID=UPI002E7A629B|nr:hypothetical protein [Gemmiger sp.]MEE0800657.1 hypothetical protein [Gemmiger sp.]